jgi:hypothetical protein
MTIVLFLDLPLYLNTIVVTFFLRVGLTTNKLNHIRKLLIFVGFLIQLGKNFILQLLGGIHMRIIDSGNYFPWKSFVFKKKHLSHSIWRDGFSVSFCWSQKIVWCKTFDMDSKFCDWFVEEESYYDVDYDESELREFESKLSELSDFESKFESKFESEFWSKFESEFLSELSEFE